MFYQLLLEVSLPLEYIIFKSHSIRICNLEYPNNFRKIQSPILPYLSDEQLAPITTKQNEMPSNDLIATNPDSEI